MSYYEDERPRRQRSTRDRPRDDYADETAYNSRNNIRTTTLVKRRDDSSPDSIEEVRRDFSPPGGYYRETTIRKSGTRPARPRSYENDRYDDRFDDRSRVSSRRADTYVAGKRSNRGYDDNRDRNRRYDDYSDGSSRSRTPPRKDRERRKSMPEEALAALGLGGLATTLLGKKSRSRSRDRDNRSRSRGGRRDRSSSHDRSRGKSHGREQLTQALKAAVLAGAGEAFRARKEPGGWGGDKGKRILTAAFSAGGVDGLINSNKDPEHHSKRDTIGSAIAGIATSRIVNGPRSQSRGRGTSPDSRGGRSRSRVGDLAAGGVVAAAAKKAYDSVRGRSKSHDRGRGRSRSSSYDSYDSRSPPKRSRSRSVVAKGLAAVGLKDAATKVDPTRRSRRYSDEYIDDRSRHGGQGYDDVGQPRSGPSDDGGRSRSVGPSGIYSPSSGGYKLDYGPHHNGDPSTDSNSDLGSSSDDEKELKKGRKRQVVSAGLATVATIHAGHSVYQSMEKRDLRKKAVAEGKISTEQAKQNRNRDRLQDAASIGLAALGLKGAYSEWSEMRETTHEYKENQEKVKRHKIKREARRRKLAELEKNGYSTHGYANSMPNLGSQPMPPLGNPHYNGAGPYNPANAGQSQQSIQPHYYDDNPYGWMNSQPQTNGGYPPPPVGQHMQ